MGSCEHCGQFSNCFLHYLHFSDLKIKSTSPHTLPFNFKLHVTITFKPRQYVSWSMKSLWCLWGALSFHSQLILILSKRRTPYSTNRSMVSGFNTAEVKAKIFVEQHGTKKCNQLVLQVSLWACAVPFKDTSGSDSSSVCGDLINAPNNTSRRGLKALSAATKPSRSEPEPILLFCSLNLPHCNIV